MIDETLNQINVEKELQHSFDQKYLPGKQPERVAKLKEKTKEMRSSWQNTLSEHADSFNDIKKLISTQSVLFTNRQRLVEEIYYIQEKIEREINKLKKMKQYYFKLHEKEKLKNWDSMSILINGDISDEEEFVNILVNHHSYLSETLKTLDFLIYGIKSRISLEEYS